MSEDERNRYEKETGQSWENLYNEQKKLQENKNTSLSKTISEHIETEDPFNRNQK